MLRLSFAGETGCRGNGGAQRSTEGFARVVEEVSDRSVEALRFRALDRPFGSIGLTPTERRHCRPLGSGWLRGCGWFGFPGRSHLSPDGGGFLAPPSTAWQRVATGVRVVWFPGRSHLSPDGGGLARAAVHRLAAGGYGVFTRNRSLPTMELKE